ncbi:MAG: polyamine aminopropyltransferase, partial [Pseudomonadota bacterium]
NEKSDFQQVELVETQEHGKLLAHDGMIMVTEKDEFVYHDMMAHVPLFTHPNPKNVLVIGGGDGGTVREVLKHPSVEKVTMVEIDGMVVDVCKKYIPQTAGMLEDSRVTLLIQDGVKFMKESTETFDVILVDSSEPIGPATPLFNIDFYKDIYDRLSDNGIVVSQGESPYYDMKMQKVLMGILKEVFPKVHIYNYCNMSYPSGLWSFTYASKGLCPFVDFDPQKVKGTFEYYSPEIHWGSFQLPQFMFDAHKETLTPLPKPQWSKSL